MIKNKFPNLTVGNYKLGDRGVYIGRAMPTYNLKASPLANQSKRTDLPLDTVLANYQNWLSAEIQLKGKVFDTLVFIKNLVVAGKEVKLVCWCKNKKGVGSCHGDTIVSAINQLIEKDIK